MDPDDRAKLLDELPAEVAQRLIASLSPENRKATQAILGYPPRSVGRRGSGPTLYTPWKDNSCGRFTP